MQAAEQPSQALAEASLAWLSQHDLTHLPEPDRCFTVQVRAHGMCWGTSDHTLATLHAHQMFSAGKEHSLTEQEQDEGRQQDREIHTCGAKTLP